MVEVTCISRNPAEVKAVNVFRTVSYTVSLSGMCEEYGETSGFDGRVSVVLIPNAAFSESREVTLLRRRIEWMLRGKDENYQETSHIRNSYTWGLCSN